MVTRYLNNKFWKMKEDVEGQYVSYIDYVRVNDMLEEQIKDNEALWKRVKQQSDDLKLENNRSGAWNKLYEYEREKNLISKTLMQDLERKNLISSIIAAFSVLLVLICIY